MLIKMVKKTIKYLLRCAGKISLAKYRLPSQIKRLGIDRLHIGCGNICAKGWLNIDLFSRVPAGFIFKKSGAYCLHHDVREIVPAESNSTRHIYASHFLEHLDLNEGKNFLRDACRALAIGGIIRITFPDMDLWMRKYCENDEKFFQEFYSASRSFPNLKTKGEIFAGQFYGWEHRWMYDFESVKHLLEEAGFSNIKKKNFLESQIEDIEKLEPSSKSRLIETCYVEAEKTNSKSKQFLQRSLK